MSRPKNRNEDQKTYSLATPESKKALAEALAQSREINHQNEPQKRSIMQRLFGSRRP